MMSPIFSKLSDDSKFKNVTFAQVDVDVCTQSAQSIGQRR